MVRVGVLPTPAVARRAAQIARQLWVTEQTVKFHLSNIYRKLGLANRTQAARYAHLHDLAGSIPARAFSSIAVDRTSSKFCS